MILFKHKLRNFVKHKTEHAWPKNSPDESDTQTRPSHLAWHWAPGCVSN